MHYKVDDWRILPDNEQSILEALAHQPVIVNIPITTALTTYKEGLLDICHSVKDDDVSSAINLQSVLLIGWGIFQSNYGNFKYWIIKNQCGSEWSIHGYCNIVMNSDAPRLYEAIHGQLSVEEKQDYGVCYDPLVPFMMKSGYQPTLFQRNAIDISECAVLKNFLFGEEFKEKNLIILLHSSACIQHVPQILEDFNQIAKAYELDEDVILLKVDLDSSSINARLMFRIRSSIVALLVLEAKSPRNIIETIKFRSKVEDHDII